MNWDILVLTWAPWLPYGIRVSHAYVSSIYSGDDAFVVSITSTNASAVIPIIPVLPVPIAAGASSSIIFITRVVIISLSSMSTVA